MVAAQGLVGAPTIERATSDGRDAMREFNLYPLQFDADVGYMHTGIEVRRADLRICLPEPA